jgi:hypothetical protein
MIATRRSPAPAAALLALAGCAWLAGSSAAADHPRAVAVDKDTDALRVSVDGKPFFTYRYGAADPELPRPVIHPLHGPTGAVITQMGEVPGKKEKHFHHTALWLAHQNFTGGNNWQIDADPAKRPTRYSRILHREFVKVEGGDPARIVERLSWDSADGKALLVEETRTITVPRRPPERRVIDFDLVLRAKDRPVTLNATPYHLLAVRALDSMVPAFGKEAVITNSQGQKNPADGAAAHWIDVTGPAEGKTVGITLMNHPANFRHPTPCLNFANQTIGLSPTHQESHTLAPDKPLRLRFRVLVHAGTAAQADVAREYAAYAEMGKTE